MSVFQGTRTEATQEQQPLHVVIIGAGLGGLCLAQGLKKAGISVAVYERDRTPTDRLQGYRIHIEPHGSRALYACLPPHLFDAFVATSGKPGKGFGLLDEHLNELVWFGGDVTTETLDPAESHRPVSRITLRQILLTRLDDVVHFDKTFTHYTAGADSKVTAFFEDGTSATGDVLVGADGGNSRLRQQFLPHAQRVETGVVGIMGKLPMTDTTRALLPSGQFDGAAMVLGPHGCAMFIATYEARQPGAGLDSIPGLDTASLASGLLYDNTSDYIFWGFIAPKGKFAFPGNPWSLDGAALQQVASDMTQTWHPRLHGLIRAADPATIIYTSIRTSIPVKAWETKTVTLLGDAIHSMTPAQGVGGNTALRDAQVLCQNLVAAQRGEKPLIQAIHTYEAAMIDYGFEAVRRSKRSLDMFASRHWLIQQFTKLTFKALGWLQAFQRRQRRQRVPDAQTRPAN